MFGRKKRESLRHCWHEVVQKDPRNKTDQVCCHCDRHYARVLQSFSSQHGTYAPESDKTERRWVFEMGSVRDLNSVCTGYKWYPDMF